MNTTSASRADTATSASSGQPVLIWDAPVRVFHWLMVVSFAGAFLTAESERWRLLHVTLGYTMAGLVGFRILWGLFGTRYARFTDFVRGPGTVARYLGSLLRGKPDRYAGHNPAGAVAIVTLLALSVAVAASGWGVYNETGGEWLEELHEAAANLMLALVFVHIAAVLLSSWLHHENLVGAMVSGYKTGAHGDGIRRAWRSVAAIMLVAVLGFWWLQWQNAPAGNLADRTAATTQQQDDDHDDD